MLIGSDDDDGPGDFTLDDFQGIETGFSKQSLEQRRLRVTKARERLRLKKLQRMQEEEERKKNEEEEKKKAEEESKQESIQGPARQFTYVKKSNQDLSSMALTNS